MHDCVCVCVAGGGCCIAYSPNGNSVYSLCWTSCGAWHACKATKAFDAMCFDPQENTYSTVWPVHLCGLSLSTGGMAMTSRLCANVVVGCRCVVSTGHHQCRAGRSLRACTGLGCSSGSRRAQEQGRGSRRSNGRSSRCPQHAPAGAVWQQHGCVNMLALCVQCSRPDNSCSQVSASSFFPSTHTHTVRPSLTSTTHLTTHTHTHKRPLLTARLYQHINPAMLSSPSPTQPPPPRRYL